MKKRRVYNTCAQIMVYRVVRALGVRVFGFNERRSDSVRQAGVTALNVRNGKRYRTREH